ncbi:thiamine-phosphate synthase [Synergistales bacterium]|nr:thiamine-phosphate synthase [Synergistales bacterium]
MIINAKWTKESLRRALRLYVIPDRVIGAPLSIEDQARLALDGGATAIQLRDKDMTGKEADGGEMLREAEVLSALCQSRGALFIVNDRLDVAILSGADGVHLGQNDIPAIKARAVAPDGFIIGVSAHTTDEARRALDGGADYLGIGAVFGTGSKAVDSIIGLSGLKEVAAVADLPSVAIGGVSLDNLSGVMNCGVDGVCVISAAVAGDVKDNVKKLRVFL